MSFFPYNAILDEDIFTLRNLGPDYTGIQHERRLRFEQHLGLLGRFLHAWRRYMVFYDTISLGMILAYVRGYLFGGEE